MAYLITSKAVIFAITTTVGDDGISTTSWSTVIGSFASLKIITAFTISVTPRVTLRIALKVGSLRFARNTMTMIAFCGFLCLFFFIVVWSFSYIRGYLVIKMYWRLCARQSLKRCQPSLGYRCAIVKYRADFRSEALSSTIDELRLIRGSNIVKVQQDWSNTLQVFCKLFTRQIGLFCSSLPLIIHLIDINMLFF